MAGLFRDQDPRCSIGQAAEQSPTRSKYFTPDLSPDGTRIAAVKVDETWQERIAYSRCKDWKVQNILKSAEIELFTDPKFIDEKTLVTAVRLKGWANGIGHGRPGIEKPHQADRTFFQCAGISFRSRRNDLFHRFLWLATMMCLRSG